MFGQNPIVGVKDENIGATGTGKTIFLPEEIKDLLTKFSKKDGWKYNEEKCLFWLTGDEESITAACNRIAAASGKTPWAEMREINGKIKKEGLEHDGFIYTRGVVTGDLKTKLIHVYNRDKDLQKLYDTLLTFKKTHDHEQKSTSAHSAADNKSATPEIFNDIILRIYGNDQDDKGNKIQCFFDIDCDSASLRTNIQESPLIKLNYFTNNKIIFVPSILIEREIAKLDTKIKKACKKKEYPVIVAIKHDLISFYDNDTQFCIELAEKLWDITRPLGLQRWFDSNNEEGEPVAVHKTEPACLNRLTKALKEVGLTFTYGKLDGGIYAIGVLLAEVYIKLILKLNASVNETVHDNGSKASNNPSPPSVVPLMITAGGHPAFTQSSPAVTSINSTLAATPSSTGNADNNTNPQKLQI